MKRFWLIFVALLILAWLALGCFAAGHEHGSRAGYATGYSAGFAAPHPIKPLALIEIDNCAGALVHISVDSAGRVFFTDEREFTEEEADFLVKLSRATGGTAHIVITDGCL